jgi:hypothetical protein
MEDATLIPDAKAREFRGDFRCGVSRFRYQTGRPKEAEMPGLVWQGEVLKCEKR